MAATACLLTIFANIFMHYTHNKSVVFSAPFLTTDFPLKPTQKSAITLEVIGFHASNAEERMAIYTLELIDHLHGEAEPHQSS